MINFNELKIPVIVSGSGKPLIILHGFLSSKEAFLTQIKYLSNYFTVVAYDLCGFGENKPMPYPYALNDYVKEFLKIANQFDEKVNVIGHSFGCRVILKAMATTNKINKAVLCGCAGLKPKPKLKKTVKSAVYRLIRPLFKKEKLQKLFFSPDYNLLCGVQKQSFKLIVNEHLDSILCKIKMPTLAIFGENDLDTPPKWVGKKLQKGLSDCTFHVIKNTGHFCFCEKPNEFCLVVKEFLL